MKTGGWIALIGGIVCLLASLGTLGLSAMLPVITDGKVDFEEALPGMIGGACCTSLSVLIAVVGVILLIVGAKKTSGGAAPPR